MKKSSYINRVVLLAVTLMVVIPKCGYAQRVIKIGKAEISAQSPITISKVEPKEEISKKPIYPRSQSELYFGLGTAIPIDRDSKIDMHYGKINSIEIGRNYFYRTSPGFALGTFVQYSFYNFKLKDAAANNLFVDNIPGVVKKEYYRTDNIGTGIVNRFYIRPGLRTAFMIDLGAYADFSFSKRYNVKSELSGEKTKEKYRDGSTFNPLQAGAYGAVTVGDYSLFIKYRATNLFNPSQVDAQLPELFVGARFIL